MDKSQLTLVDSRKLKNETTHKELDDSGLLEIFNRCNSFVKVTEENFSKYYEENHTQQLLNSFDNLGK